MNIKNNFGTGSCLLLFCALLSACERGIDNEELLDGDVSRLVITASIDEAEDVELGLSGSAASTVDRAKAVAQAAKADAGQKHDAYVEADGFDVMTSMNTDWKNEDPIAAQNNSFKNLQTTSPRAVAPVRAGIKYRLVLYKVVNGVQTYWREKQLVSSTSTAVDTTQQIEVVKGDSYRWYAYSYNNENDIPPLANRGTNAQIDMGLNSDFLYASGDISISATGAANRPLDIVFQHKVARLAIEVDARGMFADNITSLGVNVVGLPGGGSPFTRGTLGLLSGLVEASQSYTPTTTLSVNNFQNVDAGFNDRKVIYYYTATPVTLPSLSVGLTNVTISITDPITPTVNTVRTFTGLTTNFAFGAISNMIAGRTYNAKIDLIESPLPFQGVRWARTNLYLHPSGRNPYRFHATYAHTNMRSSYWPFRSSTPYMFSDGTVGPTSDPCALVHPTASGSRPSVWRQATRADFTTLGFRDLLLGVLPLVTRAPAGSMTRGQTSEGREFYEYPTSGSAAQYSGSALRFNMNGYGTAIEVVSGLVTIDIGLTDYGTDGRIWSQDRLLEVGNVLGLGAYSFHFRRVPASLLLGAYNRLNPDIVEVLSASLLGGGLLNSSFQNVRCVRR